MWRLTPKPAAADYRRFRISAPRPPHYHRLVCLLVSVEREHGLTSLRNLTHHFTAGCKMEEIGGDLRFGTRFARKSQCWPGVRPSKPLRAAAVLAPRMNIIIVPFNFGVLALRLEDFLAQPHLTAAPLSVFINREENKQMKRRYLVNHAGKTTDYHSTRIHIADSAQRLKPVFGERPAGFCVFAKQEEDKEAHSRIHHFNRISW
ncbi:uncharacterized protein [Engystomops pustulosus]|uniref:uncharacterized protein n=1 Tax=Engystomops pustulosus TaxID=76066 RepID=UPI003AFB2759